MNRVPRLAGVGLIYGAITAVFFTAIMSFDQGWRKGLPAGIGAGLAFGALVVVFEMLWGFGTTLMRSREQPSFPGETIVKAGEARHVAGIETVLGSLYLTNKALHFRSHSRDARPHQWRVALHRVDRADAARVLWILSNGLKIATARDEERFLTDDDRGWVRRSPPSGNQPSSMMMDPMRRDRRQHEGELFRTGSPSKD